MRCPAWCDRVLVNSQNPSLVNQLFYRCSAQNISDHNPVGGLFSLDVRSEVRSSSQTIRNVRNELRARSAEPAGPPAGLLQAKLCSPDKDEPAKGGHRGSTAAGGAPGHRRTGPIVRQHRRIQSASLETLSVASVLVDQMVGEDVLASKSPWRGRGFRPNQHMH